MSDSPLIKEELEARVEELEGALQEFVSAAAHDLAEPARTIGSFLSLLDGRCSDRLDEDERQYLLFAVNAAARMRSMLDALLDISRVRTHGHEFGPVDMNLVFTTACRQVQDKIDEAGASVTSGNLPFAMGDMRQLLTVLVELLENAVIFAGEHTPRICIEGHVSDRDGETWCTYVVRDNGPGIPEKFLDDVFTAFRRLQPRSASSGVGAGLTLCKRIVKHHGGEIWIESTFGEGCAVSFSVPGMQES